MSTPTSGSRVRIGDADRDAAAAALGEHFASGRLDREEFDERLERAWAARTADDLDPLFIDLPRGYDHRVPVPSQRAEAVGFGDRRSMGPRRRMPFGLPPPLGLVLVVALVLTVVTHLPIVFLVLGGLWITGVIGHRGRMRGGHWAHSR